MNPTTAIRRNRRRWLVLGLIAFAVVGFMLLRLGRGASTVERWMDSQRARGERFTLAELGMDQRPPLSSPVLDALDAAQTRLTRFHRLNPGKTVNSVDQDADAARVLWKQPRMESVAAFTADWEVMYPFMMLSAIALPNLQRALETTVRTETRRRLAVVAVALERFRCLHGRYPDELNELAPAFLAVLPPDPCTAQPFGYRLTDPELPRLWSVGADGRDDDGTAGADEVWLLRNAYENFDPSVIAP